MGPTYKPVLVASFRCKCCGGVGLTLDHLQPYLLQRKMSLDRDIHGEEEGKMEDLRIGKLWILEQENAKMYFLFIPQNVK